MQRTFDSFATWSTEENKGSAEEALARQIEILQGHAGGPRGYRLRRIILTNFWLYGQQDFEILHGRLFLAGENASGKSTVLTAALPLALDGDLRPNRLDTFGGRERHIEYYVLGGTESATPFSHERRTAYIALEFEWCDPDSPPIAQELRQRWENGEREKTRFLTIGLSLAGNVNASDRIRPLRFLITDGSRLGYDISTVYETGNKSEKRAYDHARFKQVLEGRGIVCDTRDDYERQVARYLFGFRDVKEFQKLINLLLVLRRPNLSTELNFSRVHDFLKLSLRKISGETTHRVIGTIERIDAIQSEIEHLQEAYDATGRLHHARQGLAVVEAQFAACEYTGVQLAEDNVQSQVNKLRKDLFAANNERQLADTRSKTLQAEIQQVNGQIKALEASEGLQVATRLASVREHVQETRAQMLLQEQNLEEARRSIRENRASVERQRLRFDKTRTASATQLRELRQVATEEALWDVAAFQLEEALLQTSAISIEAPSTPEVPSGVTSLIGVQSDERIAWLRHLEELHKQREKLDTKVQYARSLETTRFQELDDARRRFQSVQDRAFDTQQSLANTLNQFSAINESTSPLLADASGEVIQPQGSTLDDDAFTGTAVEQFAAILKSYREAFDTLDRDMAEAADQLQGELDELQLLAGSKMHEVGEAKALYEQKLSQPEFTPLHPTRRTLARARLAEQGIAALPLYALLDFAPTIARESAEAGRIEYMLEDAGLLDALVVAPSQLAAADALLAAEGLSDCRLKLEDMSDLASTSQHENDSHENPGRWLRFDPEAMAPASSTTTDGNYSGWDATATTVLATIGKRVDTHAMETGHANLVMNEDGTWKHGLLTGQAGKGEARFIGKVTRLHVRQRELDELHEKQAQLDGELKWLYDQIAGFEQKRSQLQEEQVQLRKVWTSSGVEEIYAELSHTKVALDEARGKYQKARLQTQEARQTYNTLIAQLERESNGVGPLSSDPKRVQTALMGVVKLTNQAKSLQLQLEGIISTWGEYQKAQEALQKGELNEAQTARLHEYAHNQALQAQAEAEELQRAAELANVEELSERLHELRERYERQFGELDEAKARYARADERARGTENYLAEAETRLQQAQEERTEKQTIFLSFLTRYPVEQLAVLQQVAERGDFVSTAQKLLGGALRESDVRARKELLEEQRRVSYNQLLQTFNQENSLLLDYGPNLDDQERILFLNENKSSPVELLEVLSERIEMQKTLLGQEERKLFEDFLLQEMAEAIRTHILEAEEWVQQINGVLRNLPMIGEHYALEWKPPAEYDLAKLGSHLARHYKLLRKPSQTLTSEEAETLMGAFRQEIEAVRQRQLEDPGMNFMEALEQIFDYREWFHFDVYVTPIGGQRQRLNDRVAGTRSGAEQLFALYVPLFAALGALYKSAAAGAPRLLALDEAFDKVSIANTQRIMEFLVSQDFQWIMTGPQISGTNAKIPACTRYLMIHEKGSPVATASASFWVGNQNLQGS